jgi:predicted DNA-binding protein with PD1-like motif
MKVILNEKNYYVLRFDKDEDVIEGLNKFLTDQAISACFFYGIGACLMVDLGYFNIHLKEYRTKPIVDDMEILSFTGNGGMNGGKPALHAHGVFGRNDFTTIGGHVNKLVVSVTCEIFLTKLDGTLERKLNPDFNLNLLA